MIQAGPCSPVDDDDLLELSADEQRENNHKVADLFTFEHINKSQLDEGSD